MKFEDLGLSPETLRAVTEKGYETPTPIQEKAIPVIMMARDVVQELFLKLARDVDAVKNARSERAVIFTMVRNLSLDLLRRYADLTGDVSLA